jgi:hypothetical protein
MELSDYPGVNDDYGTGVYPSTTERDRSGHRKLIFAFSLGFYPPPPLGVEGHLAA